MEENNLKGKTAAFLSLGCKVNSYETEAMRELFEKAGARTVAFSEKADIYVINTCTVTNIADRKSRQMLHRARKKNPESVVVAAGCYVQAAAEEVRKSLAVDVLVGNQQKKEVVSLVLAYLSGKEENNIPEISREREYEDLQLATVEEKTRACIKIQDGCNQFCSYCIIPFARGRIRSRSASEVIKEITNLVEKGYQEVVLTGIHLSSYGFENYPEKQRFDLEIPEKPAPLLELVQKIDKIPGLARIRLGSLEPRIITEEFAAGLAATKVCPHFHLSLQSGCDATLFRMNRRYNTERYLKSCEILRDYFKNPALTTDVIVGFPGETKEEFDETEKFLEKVGFAQTHIFKYSVRRGTKAAAMPNQVEEQVKAQRSDRLFVLERKMRKAYESLFEGENVEILFEEEVFVGGERFMTGHNERYVRFAVKTDKDLSNKILLCRGITETVTIGGNEVHLAKMQ